MKSKDIFSLSVSLKAQNDQNVYNLIQGHRTFFWICSQSVIYSNVLEKSSTLLEGGKVFADISLLSPNEGYTFSLQGLTEPHNVFFNNLRKPLIRQDDQFFSQHIELGYICTHFTPMKKNMQIDQTSWQKTCYYYFCHTVFTALATFFPALLLWDRCPAGVWSTLTVYKPHLDLNLLGTKCSTITIRKEDQKTWRTRTLEEQNSVSRLQAKTWSSALEWQKKSSSKVVLSHLESRRSTQQRRSKGVVV